MEFAWVVISLLCVFGVNGSSITWGKSYTLKAVLSIPLASISEPYQVWVDAQTGNTRVDYYNGTTKLYGKWENGKRVYYKVHPETTDNFINKNVCHKLSSDTSIPLAFNAYLPSVKNFTFIRNDVLNNVEAQRWEKIVKLDEIAEAFAVYSIWVTFGKTSDSDMSTIPLRYDYSLFVGKKIVDYYQHDYLFYDNAKFGLGLFEIPHDLHCEEFKNSLDENEAVDPILEYIDPHLEYSRINEAFDRFKMKHNKNYINETEHLRRMHIFKNNIRYINSINRQSKSFSLAVNQFADLTDDEMLNIAGIKNEFKQNEDKEYENKFQDNAELHEDELRITDPNDKDLLFDWRDHDAITPIKDQTVLCSSCYAFTTAASVESSAYISRGCKNLVEASEQALVDCTWGVGGSANRGCNSGTLIYTLKWIKNNGIPDRSEYGPYLAMEDTCRVRNMTKFTTIYGYQRVKDNNQYIKNSLRKYGPMPVAIDGRPKSFIFYSNGIYDDNQCSNIYTNATHGVVIIGYGRKHGRDYWILKNSYGAGWGEQGYMRIIIKNNICGVKNEVYRIRYLRSSVMDCFSEKKKRDRKMVKENSKLSK